MPDCFGHCDGFFGLAQAIPMTPSMMLGDSVQADTYRAELEDHRLSARQVKRYREARGAE